jgi:hypothetical protein
MDFIPQNFISKIVPQESIQWFLKKYYNVNDMPVDVFYALNLQWPNFELPSDYKKYFCSFHTEYVDIDWLINQAQKIYPSPFLCILDYDVDSSELFPDNLKFIKQLTLHKQIKLAADVYGIRHINDFAYPEFKLSSLSWRITQYKKFITAYLKQNFDHTQMILSYHSIVGKEDDLHNNFPFDYLTKLDLNIGKFLNNCIDETSIINSSPVENANWHVPAFQNALFNLTNESFHYSMTIKADKPFVYPGPYLTDKTIKPLIAGRPIIPVGQAKTIEFLKELGFNFNYGLDLSFDNDTGDLSRIKGIFDTIDRIQLTPLKELYEMTENSVNLNLSAIATGIVYDIGESVNKKSQIEIEHWITQ